MGQPYVKTRSISVPFVHRLIKYTLNSNGSVTYQVPLMASNSYHSFSASFLGASGCLNLGASLSTWCWARSLRRYVRHTTVLHRLTFMKRLTAAPEHKASSTRCKLTLIREATATVREPLPFDATQPFVDHFHPAPGAYRVKTLASIKARKDNKLLGLPFQTMVLEPRADEVRSLLAFKIQH